MCGSSLMIKGMRPTAYNCCCPQQVTWLILSMRAGFLELSFWTSCVAGEHPEPSFCLFFSKVYVVVFPTSLLEIGQAHAYYWAALMILLHLKFWSHDYSVLCFWHVREARDGKKSSQSLSYCRLVLGK